MRMRVLVALAAGLMVGSDPAPDLGEVKQEQVIPPGSRWVSWDYWGEKRFEEEFTKDGVWQTYGPDGKPYGSPVKYTLTPKATTPRIDVESLGLRRYGIYKLEGDRLLICTGGWGQGRATKFVHQPGHGHILYVLKRLK